MKMIAQRLLLNRQWQQLQDQTKDQNIGTQERENAESGGQNYQHDTSNLKYDLKDPYEMQAENKWRHLLE